VEVGIDAEDGARQVGLDLIRRYFSHEEHQMLERLEPLERQRSFLELWTLKEAYLKARGLGVSERGLSNVGFQRTPTRRRLPSFGPGWQDDPSDWYCEAWNEGGIQLAASVRAGQLPVQVVQRTWSV
jgi:4'-phosphopantetheinyl transferase